MFLPRKSLEVPFAKGNTSKNVGYIREMGSCEASGQLVDYDVPATVFKVAKEYGNAFLPDLIKPLRYF